MNDFAISKASALDLGAETPEKIAISIIGEMQSVLANRHGGELGVPALSVSLVKFRSSGKPDHRRAGRDQPHDHHQRHDPRAQNRERAMHDQPPHFSQR